MNAFARRGLRAQASIKSVLTDVLWQMPDLKVILDSVQNQEPWPCHDQFAGANLFFGGTNV